MKLINSRKYWIFSSLGWVILILITLTLRKIIPSLETLSPEKMRPYLGYQFSEGISCGILAFAVSFILLFYIERKLDFEKISTKKILELVALFIIVQVIYSILLWPMLDVFRHIFFPERDLAPITLIGRVTNMIYFSTIFLIWFFVVFVIKGYQYLNNIRIKQLELETNLNASRLNTLKGQINPHFMFNSLNNIRGLMLEDIGKSRNILTKLSEMLRYSLTKYDVNAIALEEELEMVDNYISISKIQFEDRLEFIQEIEKETLANQIPPMIIQLLIENAAKHGISNLKEGGIIKLTTKHIENNLEINVRNTGKLRIDSNSTQLGLNNIKQRLRLLYGEKATFSLVEETNEVVATIKIPLA